jgi:hypothetical protein
MIMLLLSWGRCDEIDDGWECYLWYVLWWERERKAEKNWVFEKEFEIKQREVG